MFSAFSGRCDPEYRGLMHEVSPDLRSDKKSDFKNGKKEDKNKTDSENPFGGLRAFQNGFARTRSDADASTHKKGARRHADASDEANADR